MPTPKPKPKSIHAPTVPANLEPKMTSVLALKHHPANVREHSEENIQAVMASLKRFGFQYPIVVDKDNQVIAGNGRLEASKRLGFKAIPVVFTQLEGDEAEAYAIADNRTSDLSQFNYKKLADTLKRLGAGGTEIADLGWEQFELKPLLNANWAPPEIPDAEKQSPAQRMKTALDQIRALCQEHLTNKNAVHELYAANDVVERVYTLVTEGLGLDKEEKKDERVNERGEPGPRAVGPRTPPKRKVGSGS